MTDKEEIGETPSHTVSGTPPMTTAVLVRHSTLRSLAHHALHDLGGVPHLEHVGGVDEGVGLHPKLAARREKAVDVLHLATEKINSLGYAGACSRCLILLLMAFLYLSFLH